MSLVLTSGPSVEPITLAEAKAHLRVEQTAEDALIGSLIITSRLHIETALGLALITQGWSYFIDRWPKSRDIILPLRPVQAINAIRIYADDTTYVTLPAGTFALDGAGLPARVVRTASATPSNPARASGGIEFALTAGFGATPAAVPAPIRQALLLLVAHWFEHRDPIEIGSAETRIPAVVSDLLAPYKPVRL